MQTTATLNPILTVVANAFMRDPKGFVADIICPRFPAPLQAGTYYKFDVDDIANVADLSPRAPGAPYHRITNKVTNDSYNCENYGLEAPAPDEERKKYATYFDLDRVKVSRIIDTIRVNREKRVTALVGTLPNANIATAWNDPSSNPKADVDAACEVIRQQSGTPKANVTMTINHPTFLALQTHPKLVDLFKYTSPGVLNEDKLAAYFGVRRVDGSNHGCIGFTTKPFEHLRCRIEYAVNVAEGFTHTIKHYSDIYLAGFGRPFFFLWLLKQLPLRLFRFGLGLSLPQFKVFRFDLFAALDSCCGYLAFQLIALQESRLLCTGFGLKWCRSPTL